MPVVNRSEHKVLLDELRNRYTLLVDAFSCRELKSNKEGVKGRGHWLNPEMRVATEGGESELRMAVDDFKTILVEIRRLK